MKSCRRTFAFFLALLLLTPSFPPARGEEGAAAAPAAATEAPAHAPDPTPEPTRTEAPASPAEEPATGAAGTATPPPAQDPTPAAPETTAPPQTDEPAPTSSESASPAPESAQTPPPDDGIAAPPAQGEPSPSASAEAAAPASEPRFCRGYALVAANARVYKDRDLREALGYFTADAVVYALGRDLFDDVSEDVLEICFAAAGANTGGYIAAGDAYPLDAAAVERYLAGLEGAPTFPAGEDDCPIAEVSFFSLEASAAPEQPPVSSVPPADPLPEPSETPPSPQASLEAAPALFAGDPQDGLTVSGAQSREMSVGEVLQLTVAEDVSAPVVWTSADAGVASVDESGRVTAVAEGATTITAQANGLFAGVAVRVTDPGLVRAVRVFRLDGTDAVLERTTLRLFCELTPLDADVQTVYWKSSDESVATVSGDGLVTVKAAERVRTVTISACSADALGARGEIVLRVYPACEDLEILRDERPAASPEILAPGESARFSLSSAPVDALPGATLVSDNPAVASVSQLEGAFAVTANAAGTARLTAVSADGRVMRSLNVRVQKSVASISLPQTLEIGYKKSLTLCPEILPADATSRAVVWKSDAPRYVSVSSKGVIRGLRGGGPVRVTAVAADGSGVAAEVYVTVKRAVSRVSLSAPNRACIDFTGEDKTLRVAAGISPADASGVLVWTSSNPDVATVDAGGLVTVHSLGTAKIVAAAQDGSRKYGALTVSVVIPVREIALSGPREVGYRRSVALKASVLPEDASNRAVNWSSSNPAWARVSSKGVVTGLRPGKTVQITATARDAFGAVNTETFTVTVMPAVTRVSVAAPAGARIDFTGDDRTLQLAAAVAPASASAAVAWTSGNPAVLEVDQNGLVTALAPGAAKVGARALDGSGKSATITVYVDVPAESIRISGPGEVGAGRSVALQIAVLPETATDKSVRWTSSDTSIARVSAKGVVTGLRQGTAVIAAASVRDGAVRGEYAVTVMPAASGVSILPADLAYDLDDPDCPQTIRLQAEVHPAASASQAVIWKSGNENVVEVLDEGAGLLRLTGGGAAKLTAVAADGSGKSASVTIRVQQRTQSLSLTGPEELLAGKTAALGVLRAPAAVSDAALKWESSDARVVAVNGRGALRALSPGEATITVRALDGSQAEASLHIRVYAATRGVRVAPAEGADRIIDLNVETQLQLTASALPAAAVQRFSWYSSNTKIATVDENGLVTAVAGATGSVKIKAIAAGTRRNAVIELRVQRSAQSVAIENGGEGLVLGQGRTARLRATVAPEDATDRGVIWKSSNSRYVAVNAQGYVKALRATAAPVTVTATARDGSRVYDSIEVTVCPVVRAVSLRVKEAGGESAPVRTGATIYLYGAGKSLSLEAAVNRGAYAAVAWTSANEAVAVVDGQGTVTATGNGVARITARALDGSGKSAYILLRVGEAADDVQVSGPHAVALRKSVALTATVLPAGAANPAVTWSSSDSSIAQVSAKGVVTGKKTGRAVITATAVGTDGEAPARRYVVDVVPRASGVSIVCAGRSVSGMTQELGLGWSTPAMQLAARVSPATASQQVAWRSSNARCAVVDQNGVVTARRQGYATIYVKTLDGSNRISSVRVKVTGGDLSVSLAGDTAELACGARTALRASISPDNPALGGVDWYSSNASLATVDERGVVSANAGGLTGPVTVTAVSRDMPERRADYMLNIVAPIDSMTLNGGEELVLDLNSQSPSAALSLAIEPAGASRSVEWKSDDESVATVSRDGLVTGVSVGRTTVRAVSRDGTETTAACSVRVARRLQGVSVSAPLSRLYAGETLTLEVALDPAGAGSVEDSELLWETSNPAWATVSAGVVAVADGIQGVREVVITARARDGGAAGSVALTVSTAAGAGFSWSENASGGLTVTAYAGEEIRVRVPERIGAARVTVIGSRAFAGENCARILSVTFPEGVLFEDGALAGLTGLQESTGGLTARDGFVIRDGVLCAYGGPGGVITVPAGVRRIDEGVFAGNASITGVRMPDTVEEIGARAFAGCSGLVSISCY